MLGHYVYGGELNILDLNPREQRVKILEQVGFVPQIPPPLKMTVAEMLDFFSKITKTHKDKFTEIAYDLGLQLKENMGKAFLSLSGGMKQKLLVAFAIGRKPKILLLDEPSANLDPKAREVLFQYLDDFDKNALMILSSHRMNEISTLVTRVIEMDLGKIVIDEYLDADADSELNFNYELLLEKPFEELERILVDWDFSQNSNKLIWKGNLSQQNLVKFMNITSKYSKVIKTINSSKT
jgi:ABC-2 type transport system ATP-binding protein